MMRVTHRAALAAAIGGAILVGGAARAQGMDPAEVPPTYFAGSQYVDSRGCAFVRAGMSGEVAWVPRLSRDRQPVCGLAPTVPTAVPVVRAAVHAGAPASRVAAPAATVPAISVQATSASVEPVRLTMEEACLGLAGVQNHLRDGRTGALVDCGPVAVGSVSVAQVGRGANSPATVALPSVPASNPIGLAAVPGAPARGFERVWEDGRVNVRRGLPRAVAGAVVVGSQRVAPGVVTIPVPVEAAPPTARAEGLVVAVPAPPGVVPVR